MKKITFAYMCFLLLVYPFYTEGNYFNIVEAKWKLLLMVTIIFLLEWLVVCLWQKGFKRQRKDGLLLFLGGFATALIISACLSKREVTAWTGVEGRYTGSIFLLLMLAVLFTAEKSLKEPERRKLLGLFGIGGIFMGLWTVLNFIGVDIFGMHKDLHEGLVRSYVAGIGNIVFLGNYFCMVFAVGAGMSIMAQIGKQRGFWGAVTICGALGIFLSGSDSAVLCAGALLFGLACMSAGEENKAKGYVFILMCVIAAGVAAGLLRGATVYKNGAYDNVMIWLLNHYVFIIAGFCMIVFSRWIKTEGKMRYWVRGLVAVATACVVFIAFYYMSGVVFDEFWGNGRGYAWINGGKIFWQEPFVQKIFGNGGDCFKELLIEYTGSNVGVNGQSFDNAHCEYLEYLLCYGILGLGAYMAMVGMIIRRCIKRGNTSGFAVAAGMCGYLLQSAMGLNQVITTPVFFGLCALGCVEKGKEEVEEGQRLYEQ